MFHAMRIEYTKKKVKIFDLQNFAKLYRRHIPFSGFNLVFQSQFYNGYNMPKHLF